MVPPVNIMHFVEMANLFISDIIQLTAYSEVIHNINNLIGSAIWQ